MSYRAADRAGRGLNQQREQVQKKVRQAGMVRALYDRLFFSPTTIQVYSFVSSTQERKWLQPSSDVQFVPLPADAYARFTGTGSPVGRRENNAEIRIRSLSFLMSVWGPRRQRVLNTPATESQAGTHCAVGWHLCTGLCLVQEGDVITMHHNFRALPSGNLCN